MTTINNGGPAFPMQDQQAIHDYAVASVSGITDIDERDRAYLKARADAIGGLTMRDYFAAQAMQGMVAAEYAAEFLPDLWSLQAYKLADAMLNARKIDPQQ